MLQLLLFWNTGITLVAWLVGCLCKNIARVGAVPRQLPLSDATRHGARVRKRGDCSRKRMDGGSHVPFADGTVARLQLHIACAPSERMRCKRNNNMQQ